MKKILLLASFSLLGLQAFCQQDYRVAEPLDEKKASITIGFLQGGGSLLGADLEALVSKQVGLQIGAGIFGFGTGINYHFQPSIRSSFVSLQYWHQGFGEGHVQSAVGPNFVYRSKKWFTAQIGMGKTLGSGPAFPAENTLPPVMLMYSIGGYIPL